MVNVVVEGSRRKFSVCANVCPSRSQVCSSVFSRKKKVKKLLPKKMCEVNHLVQFVSNNIFA